MSSPFQYPPQRPAPELLQRLMPDRDGRFRPLDLEELDQVIQLWRQFPKFVRTAGEDEDGRTWAMAVHQHCLALLMAEAERAGLDGGPIQASADLAKQILVDQSEIATQIIERHTETADWDRWPGRFLEHLTLRPARWSRVNACDNVFGQLRARKAVPTGGEGDSRAVGETPYMWKKVGDAWHVRFEEETGVIKAVDGMRYIARLLAEPYKKFSAEQLKGIATHLSARALTEADGEIRTGEVVATQETAQEVVDEEGINACQTRLQQIELDRQTARETGDTAKLEDLEEEEQQIRAFLSTARNVRGDFRQIGDKSRSTVNSVKQAIERARRRIERTDPSLPKLVSHLRETLEWANGAFEYHPPSPAPAWEL